MTLFLATLLPGIFLLLLGVAFVLDFPAFNAAIRSLPRSRSAAVVLFGGGAAWFLWHIWHLSSADFGDYRTPLFIAFAALALLAFKCIPDFLAVRGLCVLILLTASPLLSAAFMEYQYPQRLFMVTLVYVLIALSLWMGASPFRLRDFFEWLFVRRGRSRIFGLLIGLYGVVLVGVSFTY